jgi:hypothetical protein
MQRAKNVCKAPGKVFGSHLQSCHLANLLRDVSVSSLNMTIEAVENSVTSIKEFFRGLDCRHALLEINNVCPCCDKLRRNNAISWLLERLRG